MTSDTKKPIIFYTSRTAPACRAVQMVAIHLNLPLKEIKMRCYIDTRTEKFRKTNPCHTLPMIDDDGFILWESRAIMQYFCNQYAPHSDLYPLDPQKRATVDRLLNFDLKTLSHAVWAVHFEFMFLSEYSATRCEKFIALTDALTLLEIFLIDRHYVACDHLTIADISILASVSLLEIAVEFDLSTYSNIWSWIHRLRKELPYYDSLTKGAHDELRALIQSVRDAHDEWSSPLPKCAFKPDDSTSCIQEQRRQYKRLFSHDADVDRIMAAIPVFSKCRLPQSNGTVNNRSPDRTVNNSTNRNQSESESAITAINYDYNNNSSKFEFENDANNNNEVDNSLQTTIESLKSPRVRTLSTASILESSNTNNDNVAAPPYAKRIRVAIEPVSSPTSVTTTGPQPFQLSHIESSIMQ